jgi:hypothetical protein
VKVALYTTGYESGHVQLAIARKFHGNRLSDAAAGACDNCRLAGQPEQRHTLLQWMFVWYQEIL